MSDVVAIHLYTDMTSKGGKQEMPCAMFEMHIVRPLQYNGHGIAMQQAFTASSMNVIKSQTPVNAYAELLPESARNTLKWCASQDLTVGGAWLTF